MARNLGLSRMHIDYLEYLVRVCKVQQPFLVFSNPGLLDDLLRKGIYSLQQNAALKAEDRERRMAHLFQIKQIIERNAKRAVGISSTSFLRIGQGLTITPEGGMQYQCRVMSNMRDLLAVSAPAGDKGIPVRWSRGTRVKLSFWREGDAGYSFESKVVAYDTIKGVPCILIQHSRSLRRAQQRKYRRSPLNRPCFFYPVHIVEQQEGRTTERKALVQANRRLLGHLLDISAGGCSISSLGAAAHRQPLQAGVRDPPPEPDRGVRQGQAHPWAEIPARRGDARDVHHPLQPAPEPDLHLRVRLLPSRHPAPRGRALTLQPGSRTMAGCSPSRN